MRTRIMPSMTIWEVEQYLKRNDIVFVPVGVQEMHGCLPLDVEYVQAEAYARLFAEQVDGLVLPNLSYFHPGATQTGRGTVHTDMVAGIEYIMQISRSLLSQGFRRQVYIPGHGPISAFLLAAITQFFDETHCPAMFLSPHTLFSNLGVLPKMDITTMMRNLDPITHGDKLGCNTTALGAYKICERVKDVPTGAEANVPEVLWDESWTMTGFFEGYDKLNKCGAGFCAPVPFYYGKLVDHGCAPLPETRAEIEKEADIGEKYLRSLVDKVDFVDIMDTLRRLDRWQQEVVIPQHGDHLPPLKYVWDK